MPDNAIVSHEDWLETRLELLAAEKDLTRQRDALTRRRMAMPWERVDKPYRFEGPDGTLSLAELFDGRSQLVIYHFMLAPDWEEGCKSCSFWADSFERIPVHLAHRDVTLIAVSRAPLERIEAFRKRMGWTFAWFSSHGSDFNYDYHVSFTPEETATGEAYYNYVTRPLEGPEYPGVSVFYKNAGGEVFHTYSTYERGIDMLNSAYQYLDLVPKGRDENPSATMDWVRHHDRY